MLDSHFRSWEMIDPNYWEKSLIITCASQMGIDSLLIHLFYVALFFSFVTNALYGQTNKVFYLILEQACDLPIQP